MRDTIEEQWLPIEGYEGYEVSNLGRVKRVKGYDSLGHLRNEKILRPSNNKDGYLQVSLYKEGKEKKFQVHRLVAQAFIPNPEGLKEINHKDENKTNNIVDNLEYCDRKYNMNYGTRLERQIQTRISNGTYDPELCGLIKDGDRKEHDRMYHQKNREKKLEYYCLYYQKNREKIREQQREYRRRKKKNNRPSGESLW